MPRSLSCGGRVALHDVKAVRQAVVLYGSQHRLKVSRCQEGLELLVHLDGLQSLHKCPHCAVEVDVWDVQHLSDGNRTNLSS